MGGQKEWFPPPHRPVPFSLPLPSQCATVVGLGRMDTVALGSSVGPAMGDYVLAVYPSSPLIPYAVPNEVLAELRPPAFPVVRDGRVPAKRSSDGSECGGGFHLQAA